MIVQCPSCHTRYRHDAEAFEAILAECGNCEETVPLVATKRRYALLSPQTTCRVVEDRAVLEPAASEAVSPVAGRVDEAPDTLPESIESVEKPESSGRPARERPDSGPADLGIALAPSAIGAVLAYYLAGQQNQDPVTWAALGGAMGLLLGWACLLWIRRND